MEVLWSDLGLPTACGGDGLDDERAQGGMQQRGRLSFSIRDLHLRSNNLTQTLASHGLTLPAPDPFLVGQHPALDTSQHQLTQKEHMTSGGVPELALSPHLDVT